MNNALMAGLILVASVVFAILLCAFLYIMTEYGSISQYFAIKKENRVEALKRKHAAKLALIEEEKRYKESLRCARNK